MNLLALDSSTETVSLAVQRATARWDWDGPGGASSSRHVLRQLLDLMGEAQLAMSDLNAVVFGQGPGSFTGLRTACSVAQGLAYPHQLAVLPVSCLMATAEHARLAYGCTQVLAVLDARMGEVYCAAYCWEKQGWTCTQAARTLQPNALDVPPGWCIAGNAFASYEGQWQDPQAHLHATPSAGALLSLAPALIKSGLTVAAQDAMPLYVRDRVALNTAERLAGLSL